MTRMKKACLLLVAGLAAGAAAFACVYRMGTAVQRSIEHSNAPALEWLRQEYGLTPEQFARVCELHHAYLPHCAEMCRRIDAQNTRLQQLLAATNTVTLEIEQALAETARLRAECQSAMLKHFYEVAGIMPPEQGRRYLAWVQSETLLPARMVPVQPSRSRATP